MPTRPAFLSEKERERICQSSLLAVKALKPDSADYGHQTLELLSRTILMRPDSTQALGLRAAALARHGDFAGAVCDLSRLLRLEEVALACMDMPVALTVHERRRTAALYSQRAQLLWRAGDGAGRPVCQCHAADLDPVADLQRAATLEPDNAGWPFELAMAHLRMADAVEEEGHSGLASRGSVLTLLATAVTHFQAVLHCLQAPGAAQAPSSLALARRGRPAASLSQRGSAGAGESFAALGAAHQSPRTVTTMRFRCHMNIALCRLRSGDAAHALRVLKVALELKDTAVVHHWTAQAHELLGDHRRAEAEFQRAVDMEPHRAEYHLLVSLCQLRTGQAAAAMEHVSAAILIEPTNPWMRFYCGCAHLMLEQPAEALASLTEAGELEPLPTFTMAVGAVHTEAGRYDLAERAFRSTLALDPSGYASHVQLAIVQQLCGRPHEALESYHAALRILGAATCGSAEDGAAAEDRGEVQSNGTPGRQSPRAGARTASEASPRSSIAKRSSSSAAQQPAAASLVRRSSFLTGGGARPREVYAHVLERLGVCYRELSQHNNALRCFASCSSDAPDAALRIRQAVTELLADNSYGALKALGSGGGADQLPPSFTALHCRSVALRLMGDFRGSLDASRAAEAHLTAADASGTVRGGSRAGGSSGLKSRLRPADFFVDRPDPTAHLLNRAYLHHSLGERAECLRAVQRALPPPKGANTSPEDDLAFFRARRAEAHYLEALAYFAADDAAAAVRSFNRAAETLPALAESSDYCYSLGTALARSGQQPEALRWFGRSIDRVDGAATCDSGGLLVVAHHERAKMHQALGNTAAAAEDFSYVLAAQPANFNALVRRSFAHKKLGNFAAAAADWQAAEAHDPTGLLKSVHAQDIYETDFIELCEPGDEEWR